MEFQKYKLNIIIFFIIICIPLFLHHNENIVYIENDNKFSEFEKNMDFTNLKTDIKVIALYLPQFHVIEENNRFWGKGFTEWINVKKCIPKFKGHHQPRIPGDKYGYLSYYDLSDVKNIKKQTELAKSHGIFGFGIYYYWFSGKMLLEKPINLFIHNLNIDFKFLLIWANENWSRRYDGSSNELLIKQEYRKEDPYIFIKDTKKYLKDTRYIKIRQKPVIGIYEPFKIPNLNKTMEIWREKSRELGIGEIFILICINHYKVINFQNLNLFDGCYEFPPRNSLTNNRILNKNSLIYSQLLYKSRDFNESGINFQHFPFFRGTMLEWDNCPRKKKCVIFERYSPQQFYIFNKLIIDWTLKKYINAWNEWGEGSYLEPDEKYGYASINSLSKAIFNLSYFEKYTTFENGKIAVLLSVNDENSMNETIKKINNIPYIYDLFIIIETYIRFDSLKKYIILNSNANHFEFINFFNILICISFINKS